MIVTVVPALVAIICYKKNPAFTGLKYMIVVGYFFMYTFVLLTGSTILVFTYIFPMLSLIILYHRHRLILGMGIAAFAANLMFILIRLYHHEITLDNSKDVEIQLALLFLCFTGCYMATKLYGEITRQNEEYVEMLDEKSKQIQKMTFQAITTIANTIDAKDEYTKGHSQRVSEYSYILAKELGLSEEETENIRNVALLHDIGKIGVPDSVLNKPGRLSDEEFEIMKSHPVVGADILKDIHLLKDLDVGAKYHHERYDGKGYPCGLKGEEIPYMARIIGVADAYDAMSSNRVYRKRFSNKKIMEEIEKGKGTQFDPAIADAFLKLLREERLKNLSPDSVENNRRSEEKQEVSKMIELPEHHKMLIEEMADIKYVKEVEKDIVFSLKTEDGCLVLIDIDDFGEMNERYGYLRGDYCLMVAAEVLRKTPYKVSRIDGDEFLCFIPYVSSVIEGEHLTLELMQKLRETFDDAEELKDVTISAGVSLSAVSGRDFNKLYRDADKALYHIKQNSKNGFYIFNEAHAGDSKYMSKNDLDNLVRLIQEEYAYEGAFRLDYKEFEKVYEFVRKMGKRNAQTIQLILFTMKPADEKKLSMEERAVAMQYVEKAIVSAVRSVDVTTRYSSTQQLVMFINLEETEIQMVVSRIMKEFYRMYDKKDVVLNYDVANLDMA
jgi:diguanylate cyclase (GGDEF)-like protein/putative nucleotidyltransferase with HDIG domain